MKGELPLVVTASIIIAFFLPGTADAQIGDKPNLRELESDIQVVSLQIDETEKENARYSEGLIKTLIMLRLQILKNTKAMLEQKKYTLVHEIPVHYTYRDKIYVPAPVDSAMLESIELDIKDQQKELIKAEAENAKYSGGLIKSMILSQIATIKNTIAMLEQRKLLAKHGIPLAMLPRQELEEAKEAKKPTETAPLSSKAKMDVVDWNHRLSGFGNYIYVEGILRNVGDEIAESVKVKVTSLDAQGKPVSIEDAYADPSAVAPDQETTFQVMVRNDPRIERFKLTVLWR